MPKEKWQPVVREFSYHRQPVQEFSCRRACSGTKEGVRGPSLEQKATLEHGYLNFRPQLLPYRVPSLATLSLSTSVNRQFQLPSEPRYTQEQKALTLS